MQFGRTVNPLTGVEPKRISNDPWTLGLLDPVTFELSDPWTLGRLGLLCRKGVCLQVWTSDRPFSGQTNNAPPTGGRPFPLLDDLPSAILYSAPCASHGWGTTAQQLCFFISFALTPLCVRSGADYNRAHRLCTSGVDARINESGSEYEEPKTGEKSATAHGPWCTAASLGLTHPAHSGSGSVGSANPNNAWVRRPHRPTSRSVWRAVQRPVRGGSRASRNRPTSRRAG